ncbi:MAG: hypothetical protein QOH70_3133 [Blastocatellia bacterium]|jgi:hypothetical protein|nr:hypothetical protein [Blastocatellia bacterium]
MLGVYLRSIQDDERDEDIFAEVPANPNEASNLFTLL